MDAEQHILSAIYHQYSSFSTLCSPKSHPPSYLLVKQKIGDLVVLDRELFVLAL